MKKTILLLTVLLTTSAWAGAQGQFAPWALKMQGTGGKAYGLLGSLVVPMKGEGGSAISDFFFHQQVITSLHSYNLAESISLFPNPVVKQLTIQLDAEHKVAAYTIHNLLGGVVKTGILDTSVPKCIIEVSQLPAQLYLLKLMDKQGVTVATKSFIKK